MCRCPPPRSGRLEAGTMSSTLIAIIGGDDVAQAVVRRSQHRASETRRGARPALTSPSPAVLPLNTARPLSSIPLRDDIASDRQPPGARPPSRQRPFADTARCCRGRSLDCPPEGSKHRCWRCRQAVRFHIALAHRDGPDAQGLTLVTPSARPTAIVIGVEAAAVHAADHKLRPLRHGEQQSTSHRVRAVVVPAKGHGRCCRVPRVRFDVPTRSVA